MNHFFIPTLRNNSRRYLSSLCFLQYDDYKKCIEVVSFNKRFELCMDRQTYDSFLSKQDEGYVYSDLSKDEKKIFDALQNFGVI